MIARGNLNTQLCLTGFTVYSIMMDQIYLVNWFPCTDMSQSAGIWEPQLYTNIQI